MLRQRPSSFSYRNCWISLFILSFFFLVKINLRASVQSAGPTHLRRRLLKPSYNGTIPFTNWTFISWRLFIIFFWWPTSVTPSRLKSLWEKADVGSRDCSGTRRRAHHAPHAPMLLPVPTSYHWWLPKPSLVGKFNFPPFCFYFLMADSISERWRDLTEITLLAKEKSQTVKRQHHLWPRTLRGVKSPISKRKAM